MPGTLHIEMQAAVISNRKTTHIPIEIMVGYNADTEAEEE